jgi:hypothetical protein
MADKNKLSGFEINDWGNLKLKYNAERGTCTHEYYNVPRKIILKFLNSSKPPTLKEVDDWIKEHRDKQETNSIVADCCDFWSDTR